MSVPSSSDGPSRRSLWLLASLPLLPILLVFWAWRLPAAPEGEVIQLIGTWRGQEAREGFNPFIDTAGWKELRLPGSFSVQGFAPQHLWVQRTFDMPPAVVGHDAAFVIGSVRGAGLRLFFNDELIGVKGEPTRDFLGSESGSETFFIPAKLVRAGTNTLTIEVLEIQVPGRDGIIDPRLLFGRRDVLAPWAFHEQQMRGVLEQGVLLVIAFLAILLGVLWVLQGARTNLDLYRSTLGLLFASGCYLLGKSGFLISAVLTAARQLQLVMISVCLLGLAMGEFVEAYYLQRATPLRWANRAVSLLAIVAAFGGGYFVYKLYSLWLFGIVFYSLGLAIRDLLKPVKVFGPLVVSATLIVIAAGVLDLLGDLDVVYAPRLFPFGVANLAIMAGAVLVAEFIELARENTRLSVSLQLRAEELAEALVKAEESSRIKSEFLANTSHELRTPLNAIINIPQGLLEQFREVRRARCPSCGSLFELDHGEALPSNCPECAQSKLSLEAKLSMELAPEETSRLLRSIVRSGTHLLAVVNDILDYSKLEAGRVVLHREPVTVDALLEDLRLAMEPVATLAGVRLQVIAPAGEVTLEVDRVKVTQVLINLVGNAIKFSDGRGTVTVRAELTSGVTFWVKDEGIGIAPEHQGMIFEGFRQVEGSNTRRFGGSGLGLAISKRLVVMHGGSIRVESALGAGTTFIVDLPLSVQEEESVVPADAEVVVVVDDEVTAVDTTSVALKPLGCRVVAILDPREAMARLRENPPSLLVLDVMMPRISGLELLRQIKKDPALRDLPVLVSSAYRDNRAAVEAMGAVFIDKPWRAGELLRVATGLLAGQHRAPIQQLERTST